jgi:hypothetical protein
VIDPAPPYRGEGAHALWHVSEDATLTRFVPHHRPEHANDEPLVWAVDTRHLPLYWFPRDCPRATFWATGDSSDDDVERWLDGDRTRRVHVVEPQWLEPMKTTRVLAYRFPEETFEPWDRFWISRDTVEPLELVELGDLVERHRAAAIELRTEARLRDLHEEIAVSTLDFSGIRLRNATLSA